MKRVKASSFADRLDLWGVDHPSTHPEMLLDFIETLAQNQPVPALAQSLNELETRRSPLKLNLRHSLGLDPWPERTALNARIVGRLDRPGYHIEKLVYEAWPGLPVTAHRIFLTALKNPPPGWCTRAGIGWRRQN